MSDENTKKEDKNNSASPARLGGKDDIREKDVAQVKKLENKYNEEKYKEIRENVLQALAKEAKVKKTVPTKAVVEEKKVKPIEKEKNIKKDKKITVKNMEKKHQPENNNKKNINSFKNLFFKKNKNDESSPAHLSGKDDEKVIKKSEKSKRHPVIIIALSTLVAILLFITTLGVGIYFLNWQNDGLKKIAVYLPFPAGMVAGEVVSANDYWQDIDTLTHFYNYQVSLGNFKETPPESEIKNIVWDRLVNVKLMEQLALKYGLQVTKEQLNSEVDKLVNETGNRDLLADNLYEYYKWDIDTFIFKVIKPYLLEQKVVEKLKTEQDYESEVKEKAENVLQKALDNPDNFAELAKEYSADTVSAQRGGDLGYFNKGVMEENFENAVFAMEVGEIKGLVETSFGYHIIKLEDKKVNQDDPEDIQVKASHILIMPLSINEIVELKKGEIEIVRFLDKKIDKTIDNNELEE